MPPDLYDNVDAINSSPNRPGVAVAIDTSTVTDEIADTIHRIADAGPGDFTLVDGPYVETRGDVDAYRRRLRRWFAGYGYNLDDVAHAFVSRSRRLIAVTVYDVDANGHRHLRKIPATDGETAIAATMAVIRSPWPRRRFPLA